MGKGEAGKPKGRMSAYAYFVQNCREEHKKKNPNVTVGFSDFSKKCAEQWKGMSDKDKQRFHSMAEKDKTRYQSEMADYKPLDGGSGKGKRKRAAKDPNAPKRALSAFFWFCNDERPKVKQVIPDATIGDIGKELGRRWNKCTPEVKSKYEALAAKDKARYEKENDAYKNKKSKPAAPVKNVKDDSDEDEDDEDEDEDEDEDDD